MGAQLTQWDKVLFDLLWSLGDLQTIHDCPIPTLNPAVVVTILSLGSQMGAEVEGMVALERSSFFLTVSSVVWH